MFSGESIVTYEIVIIFAMSTKAKPIGLDLKGEWVDDLYGKSESNSQRVMK